MPEDVGLVGISVGINCSTFHVEDLKFELSKLEYEHVAEPYENIYKTI